MDDDLVKRARFEAWLAYWNGLVPEPMRLSIDLFPGIDIKDWNDVIDGVEVGGYFEDDRGFLFRNLDHSYLDRVTVGGLIAVLKRSRVEPWRETVGDHVRLTPAYVGVAFVEWLFSNLDGDNLASRLENKPVYLPSVAKRVIGDYRTGSSLTTIANRVQSVMGLDLLKRLVPVLHDTGLWDREATRAEKEGLIRDSDHLRVTYPWLKRFLRDGTIDDFMANLFLTMISHPVSRNPASVFTGLDWNRMILTYYEIRNFMTQDQATRETLQWIARPDYNVRDVLPLD